MAGICGGFSVTAGNWAAPSAAAPTWFREVCKHAAAVQTGAWRSANATSQSANLAIWRHHVSRRGAYTHPNEPGGNVRGMSLSILRTIFHRHAKPSDPSVATGLCAMLVAGDSPSLL